MQTTLSVSGMDCASCASNIQRTINKIPGVEESEVSYATGKAKISYDQKKVSIKQINSQLKPLGYELHDSTKSSQDELATRKHRVAISLPITILVFSLMIWDILSEYIAFIPPLPIPMEVSNLFLLIVSTLILFWIGFPFVKAIWLFIKYRKANMDTLIGIGTLTAYIYSSFIFLLPNLAESLNLPEATYFDVSIVVIGFVILGKYLEARSKLKTGEAIEKLFKLQAKTAIVIRNNQELEIPLNEVIVGDIIIIKPGAKIPVDGAVVDGSSFVDESMVTGEPLAESKKKGDTLIGSTINKQGVLTMEAKKVGADTMLSQIIQLVENAQGSKAPIETLANKISAIFVPIVLAIAFTSLIVWLVSGSITLALTSFVGVLVIACPCALGLATPTGIIAGVGKGASLGILIKDAESLEKLHRVNTIVMDKTGTITTGKPVVTDYSSKESLQIAASLEKSSSHPLGSAISEKAVSLNLSLSPVKDFYNIEGKGIRGVIEKTLYHVGNQALMKDLNFTLDDKLITPFTTKGKTPVFIADDKQIIGTLYIADTLKQNAKSSISSLHKMGLNIVMLTGDDQKTAESIAKDADIDTVIAQVLPQDKAEQIKKLQHQGKIVAMVGDGINDAPALATADIGIAMSTGTDVAIASAHITLLHGDISKLTKAIKLSKTTMNIIKQNLFWAFFYNLIGIPLAAGLFYPLFGLSLNPAFAGIAMAFSSVSVVLNSLRLRTIKI